MSFLRRVFGRGEPATAPPSEVDAVDPGDAIVPAEIVPAQGPEPVIRAACPSCAYPLDPPPERNRRCPSCREQIVVRRTEGRLVYLTEDAVVVFDRERQRVADEQRWTTERDTWLGLAGDVGASPTRRAHLAEAPLSADVVTAARELYIAGADNAVRTARGAKRWTEVARIRRAEAGALFDDAGNPIPPPDEIAALHREGMLAELRALAVDFKDAELVGAGCCRPCRTGDGKAFKIADELRTPRLPHEGCPKGLCACEWWLAMPGPKKRRRTRRTSPTPPTAAADSLDAPDAPVPEA